MPINPEALIQKLNPITRSTLEGAIALARTRGNSEIDVEHYVLKLIEAEQSDFLLIAKHWNLDLSKLAADLQGALDSLPSGWSKKVAPSQPLMRMLTEAWNIASLEHNVMSIRTGSTVLALVTDYPLSKIVTELSRQFSKIDVDEFRKEFSSLLGKSAEQPAMSLEQKPERLASEQRTAHLDLYTTDLTALARNGKIDPVLGRDREISKIVDILRRRRQNNPILTGEAGVGKTAIVEGFAMRVASGHVHPSLKDASVRALDLARLQGGAGVRGEFEDRLKRLIDEVASSPTPIILFIDEAHTLIGAGGSAGSSDAANLLKPALARGELRTIAATTWAEYRKYFEDDQALSRRFEVIKVEEPDEAQCAVMLRGVLATLEAHHRVTILHEAVHAAVHLSSRYLFGRQLPDKAISVLDTACARVALQQHAPPDPIIMLESQIADLERHKSILESEEILGSDHRGVVASIAEQIASARGQLEVLTTRWKHELGTVSQIYKLQADMRGGGQAPATLEPLKKQFQTLLDTLSGASGEGPVVTAFVDAAVVGQVISGWTGIPTGKMLKHEASSVLDLQTRLSRRILGQDQALNAICKRLITARARVSDPSGVVGVFLLVGPSGVGKTETALALADGFFGGERNLISVNMTEFKESHTASLLKGAPPGYKGYKEGGILTEAVRRRPYSVILLDEIEKAHPDVRELFFQIFARGRLDDAEGREIDFCNTVVLLTTNACSEFILEQCRDASNTPESDSIVSLMKPELNTIFGADFLGRLVVVPYYPLQEATIKDIIQQKLIAAQQRIEAVHKIRLWYDESVIAEVLARCREVESGARNVDAILTNTLLPDISRYLLETFAKNEIPHDRWVWATSEGFRYGEGPPNAVAQSSPRMPRRPKRVKAIGKG